MLRVYHHPNSLLHEMGPDHLEAPVRVEIIENELKKAEYDVSFQEARYATEKEIMETHSNNLYELVEQSKNTDRYFFTMDTISNRKTYDASLTAAGGAIQIAENIKEVDNQFAMLRPPGHHATWDSAMGFCFFNNIALTANTLLANQTSRIAIIDVDHHHGNGTQDLFYMSPNVLYTSMHADPKVAFPGTGFPTDVGVGDGEGYTINIPLPIQTHDPEYLVGFDQILTPSIENFKPEVILVSLGLDGLFEDPYGILALSTDGFFDIGRRVGSLAKKLTNSKVGVILEGGYNYQEIGVATTKFFEGLQNPEFDQRVTPELNFRFKQVLDKVKQINKQYW